MSPHSDPKRLRELLKQPGIIRSLGAHDVFTALIVEEAGFETVLRPVREPVLYADSSDVYPIDRRVWHQRFNAWIAGPELSHDARNG